ncbi:hypothetical protein [[Flexibacter] sp. ATCC 35208]|uniref:hypothetical protein n=1 Tax=[Flexibacter] sp. ATCC 35208 TaxID=1936242 RepID=UPI0009C86E43|nr:hypothetical protein [[Flexibacter] sp. ATCC 35208]OMP75668.1 hypothetical protein BW716_29085 [[Flexibacter] sp. ATCC 35208]
MNNFVLETWDDESDKCTFYTVRKEDARNSETDKFFNKYSAIPELKKPTQILLSFILDSIGDDYGAIDLLFNRFENEVIGLPNQGKAKLGEITFFYPYFPLRLYSLRVNNRSDLVVLFNGGVKSALTNQASRDLNLKWREACQFARRIEEALLHKEICIDQKKREIRANDGGEEIIL